MSFRINYLPCLINLRQENTVIDAYGNAQLCDFGLAKILDDVPSGLTTTRASSYTIRYAAPEIIMGESLHTIASDMWAWGCLVLFVGQTYLIFPPEVDAS